MAENGLYNGSKWLYNGLKVHRLASFGWSTADEASSEDASNESLPSATDDIVRQTRGYLTERLTQILGSLDVQRSTSAMSEGRPDRRWRAAGRCTDLQDECTDEMSRRRRKKQADVTNKKKNAVDSRVCVSIRRGVVW